MDWPQQMRAFPPPGSPEAELVQCRAALAQLAREREIALAEADKAVRGMAELLPRALQAGVSVVDAAQLAGVSRPTLYRMLSGARRQQDLRGVAARFEQALDLQQQALPFDLASHFQISIDEVFDCLMRLYPLVTDELASLGPAALTSLVELLQELGTPERIVVAMLMLQGLSADRVARSTQLPETQVLGWASLGLLRVLPRIREAMASSLQTAGQPSEDPDGTVLRSSSNPQRYPIGDPRRYQ